jgi:hypothetical protein
VQAKQLKQSVNLNGPVPQAWAPLAHDGCPPGGGDPRKSTETQKRAKISKSRKIENIATPTTTPHLKGCLRAAAVGVAMCSML